MCMEAVSEEMAMMQHGSRIAPGRSGGQPTHYAVAVCTRRTAEPHLDALLDADQPRGKGVARPDHLLASVRVETAVAQDTSVQEAARLAIASTTAVVKAPVCTQC